MTIAEALAERADLNQRLGLLTERMNAVANVQEGDKPAEDAEALLIEATKVIDRIEEITVSINLANNRAKTSGGITVMEAVAHREAIQRQIGVLKGLVQSAQGRERWGRDEIRHMPTVDIAVLNQEIDGLQRQRRALDITIQKANWQNDV